MSKQNFTPWDSAEFLNDDEAIMEYLRVGGCRKRRKTGGVTKNPRNNPLQSKTNDLEAIEKLVQRYRQTRNMQKAAMDLRARIRRLFGHQAGVSQGCRGISHPVSHCCTCVPPVANA